MWNMGGSLRRGDVRRHSSFSCSVVAGGGVVCTAVVTVAATDGTADGGGCGGGGRGREDSPITSSVGRSIGDHMPDCQQKSNDLLFCLRSTQSRRRRSAREVPEAAAAWLRYQVRGSRWTVLRPYHTTQCNNTEDD